MIGSENGRSADAAPSGGKGGSAPLPFGFNVIAGFSTIGLGQTARSIASALSARGYPVSYLPLFYNTAVPVYDDIAGTRIEDPAVLPYRVNLFVNGLPDVALVRHRSLRLQGEAKSRGPGAHYFGPDRHVNVGVPFWELPRMPRAWAAGLEGLDYLLTATDYIAEILRGAAPGVPSCGILHPVDDPVPLAARAKIRWRERLGIGSDAVVFVSSFDPNSYVARKNPVAALRAFVKMLSAVPSAALLVKTQPLRYRVGPNARAYDEVSEIAARHPRVHLVEDYLPFEEVVGLYSQGDVYVSTHRAEGLGLGLLESMGLSVPVIATGWSGNMSFMDESNSVPVGYRLVPVHESMRDYCGVSTYGIGDWAEVDGDALVRAMIDLASHPERRRALGEAARRAFVRHSQAASACEFASVLERHCAGLSGGPERSAAGAESLARLQREMVTEGDELRSPLDRFGRRFDRRFPWVDELSLGFNRYLPWRLRWRKE